MTSNLVQKLRICSEEDRRVVAFELAYAGIDEAVDELINMINAGIRIPKPTITKYKEVEIKPHWWSIRKVKQLQPYEYDPSEHYTFSDQLIGIEAIGETGNKHSLDFLKKLIEHNYSSTQSSTGQVQGIDFYPDWQEDSYTFPNAHGLLYSRLNMSSKHGVCESGEGPETIEEYRLITKTIEKLENTLRTNTSKQKV